MKLSFSIIKYELNKSFTIHYMNIGGNPARYDAPFLFDDSVNEEGRIYVLPNEKDLPERLPEKSLMICSRDLLTVSEKKYHYPVILTNAATTAELINTVQQIYDKYNYWIKSMNDILTDGRNTLQRIMSLCAEVHQNMFLLQDAGFRTIAVSWRGEFQASRPWNTELIKTSLGKQMSLEALKNIKEYFPDRRESRRAMFHHLTEIETIDIPIYNGSIYQGMLSMIQYNRDFDDQDYEIVEILSRYIAYVMSLEESTQDRDLELLSGLFSQLLDSGYVDKRHIDDICTAVGFAPEDRFIVVALQFPMINSAAYMKYVKQEIAAEVRGSTSCKREECLALVINETQACNSDVPWTEIVGRCVKEFNLNAGISEAFVGFENCSAYLQEALAALSFVSPADPSDLYWFSDFRLQYALKNSVGRLKPEMLYTEGFRRLLEYEDRAAVSYLETLQVLMEENLNTSRAARRLFISRNSFLARYERLKEVLKEDLTDPDVRFALALSLRLYHQTRAQ